MLGQGAVAARREDEGAVSLAGSASACLWQWVSGGSALRASGSDIQRVRRRAASREGRAESSQQQANKVCNAIVCPLLIFPTGSAPAYDPGLQVSWEHQASRLIYIFSFIL